MNYPILVEQYGYGQGTAIVCTCCGAETSDPDSEAYYLLTCPRGCGGCAEHKYQEADRCPNCDKLGFYEDVLDRCCSRVCQLQAEYARELRESKPGAAA